jgi:hypothetical protein
LRWHLQASHNALPQLPPLGKFNYAACTHGGKLFAHACRLGPGSFYVFQIQYSHRLLQKQIGFSHLRDPV